MDLMEFHAAPPHRGEGAMEKRVAVTGDAFEFDFNKWNSYAAERRALVSEFAANPCGRNEVQQWPAAAHSARVILN